MKHFYVAVLGMAMLGGPQAFLRKDIGHGDN
jgi:hypothetical protein